MSNLKHPCNNISKLKKCYRCSVCGGLCPVKIIDITNSNGFIEPKISHQDQCINCGLCLKVCSFNSVDPIEYNTPIGAYSTVSTNPTTVATCTSGGTVYELLKHGINNGYKAIVVRFNFDTQRPEHYIAHTIEELEESKGSKYLQSDISKIIPLLSRTEKYIVVGTPCQIASLRRYLKFKKIENNFIFIDFFCHGVPSTKLWDRYISLKSKQIGNIKSVLFRAKDFGWHQSIRVKLIGTNGTTITKAPKKDIFFNYFLGDRCLSAACYDSCSLKQTNPASDIRIGDLWGTKYLKNETGITGVITFSTQGESFLKSAENIQIRSESTDTILSGQMKMNAKRSASYPIAQLAIRSQILFIALTPLCDLIDFIYGLPKRIRNHYNF